MPSVSVVIPVKNEDSTIRACIEGILDQNIPVEEIIVLDSGSTDDTLSILEEFDVVRVVHISPDNFDHGETRNRGIREAGSEFVALTVGDARPANESWLEELLAGFEDDEVVGVCGQQIVPHEKDKNPVEWFRPQSEPKSTSFQFEGPEEFARLSPREKREAASWDDVAAMYRRSVMETIPFPSTSYAEDHMWAVSALENGHKLVYNRRARVYHYHTRSFDYAFKRTFTVAYFRYKLFGYKPQLPSVFKGFTRTLLILLRESSLSLQEKLYWAGYNLRTMAAIFYSVQRFRTALNQGEEELDRLHEKYCGSPPIPSKV